MSKFQPMYYVVTQSSILAGLIMLPAPDHVNVFYKYSAFFPVYSVLSSLPLIFTLVTSTISLFTVDENIASLIASSSGSLLLYITVRSSTFVDTVYRYYYVRRTNISSVSYTHLDVYKRQQL